MAGGLGEGLGGVGLVGGGVAEVRGDVEAGDGHFGGEGVLLVLGWVVDEWLLRG